MRVLLVSANREHVPDPIFPLGLAYIAAAARQGGHDVEIADLCFGSRPIRALEQQLRRFRPDVVGLSIRNIDNAAYPLTVEYLPLHGQVVNAIRKTTSARIVLGGSGFSILPEACMQVLDADFGVTGAGEASFVALLDALANGRNSGDIPNMLSKHADADGGSGLHTRVAAPLSLSWVDGDVRPARHLFAYARYIRRGGTGNIQTKRGCVFKCSYCTYPLLEGSRFQSRGAAEVVDEIEMLQGEYGPHPIFFVDSILNFPRGHVEGICEEILRRKLKINWSCYATPVKLDRNQAQLMARAGCEGIELGTDAVDDDQLARLAKSFDAATVWQANQHCLDAGLRVCHTLIFGAPGETIQSIRNTCQALRGMRATAVVAMTGVRIYPGTPLATQLVAEGRMADADIGLAPVFYIEPEVAGFLPAYLRQQAQEAGNWVLPGLEQPLLPSSQRMLRALGISGPLWRLLRFSWMRQISRGKFRRPASSWGVPNQKRIVS